MLNHKMRCVGYIQVKMYMHNTICIITNCGTKIIYMCVHTTRQTITFFALYCKNAVIALKTKYHVTQQTQNILSVLK